jgi:methanethiol S-methyltransferase
MVQARMDRGRIGSVERSTYVLLSSGALLLLFWKWEPMGALIWNLENVAAQRLLDRSA